MLGLFGQDNRCKVLICYSTLQRWLKSPGFRLYFDTGIDDYDLVYHDDSDLSYDAEDKVIQEAKRLFADVPAEV